MRTSNPHNILIRYHYLIASNNLLGKSLLLAWLTLMSLTLISQNQTKVDSGGINITIIDSYKPFLSDAFKIKTNPSIKDTNKIIPSLKYSFINKQVPVNFEINPIKPAKIKGEPLVKLYNGYAKVGIGNNTTPLAEFYYNSKRSKNHSFGFFGRHFSSNGIVKRGFSDYSDNHLEVFGKKFSKEFTLYGKLNYDRNVIHYYGIPDDLPKQSFATEGVEKQRFNKFSVNTALTRNFADTTEFDYNFNIDYHHLRDLFKTSENNVNIDGSLSKYHNRELYAIDLDFNFNQLNNLINPGNSLIVGLRPHISTTADKWKFKVGLGLYVNKDTDETKFHFYPEAEFKYNVVENIIIPYVGINGGIIANNLNTFSTENPYINSEQLTTLNSNQKYNIYAGIRGSISKNVTFNTSFSKQKINNNPFYVKYIDTLQNKFAVIYDNLNLIKITGELTYQKAEKFKIILSGDYYSYDTEVELEAWHQPNYRVTFSGIYDLSNKILVRADFFLIGKQYARTFETLTTNNNVISTSVAQELSGVLDANLSIEYRYTKKLSAFINFNNIGSVRYQRFQDYPTQRFGVLGGLTYSF